MTSPLILQPSLPANIRNFCIIAHVDHGKSTLSDRLIEATETVPDRLLRSQILDSMDIERERGITVKSQTVRMRYQGSDGTWYQLNLIDTPGHVDFAAEVSRSLAACEGAILLVDAAQGVQAQTVATLRAARKQGLTVFPVLNKIDSPAADLDKALRELDALDGIDADDTLLVSAKTGDGVDELLEAVIARFPAPAGDVSGPLRAFVFDSHYDVYRGAVMHVRVVDGSLGQGDGLQLMSNGFTVEAEQTGYFSPAAVPARGLSSGEVGYVSTGVKDVADIRVGDTLTHAAVPAAEALMPYEEPEPMVFAGLFPHNANDLAALREGIGKLALNDAALRFEPEVSTAIGAGFRCGFLGILHLEIVRERLLREFDVRVIASTPSVPYRARLGGGEVTVESPARFPAFQRLDAVLEPFATAHIRLPHDRVGPVMEVCQRHRGEYQSLTYPDDAVLVYELPLAEVIVGFFGEVKSASSGYATLDIEPIGFRESDLVKVEILVDTEPVDSFAFISHRDQAHSRATRLLHALKHGLPRRLYPIPLQARVENKIIARVDLPPLRKSALAQGFNGSVSAKRRLAERRRDRQPHGMGKGDIPVELFESILGI
ncbi:translation elongation factor 4 [Streptomyces mirabilis]|uniref:translation elongation factor 4 n=1 Tax=Streptomyces mirabilis TaxID=68239 RepID=UPI00364C3703